MEHSNAFSDDEYDVVSNPGNLSLEASLDDFCCCDVREPPASEIAQSRFETTRWSAKDIQRYIHRDLELATDINSHKFDKKRVRVYVDGTFDTFDIGTALKLRQAKLSFPYVYLIVGVFSNKVLQQNDCLPNRPEVERIELMRHCRWTDEVLEDVPWELTLQFLNEKTIDFVAIDEGTSIDPSFAKARVVAYDELKKHGKIIKTRRTPGLLNQKGLLHSSPSQQSTPTLADKELGS
ncbi:cholinephosphate cytidylyltransferase [Gymnopilus junonius]|uniref:choline-phosphate cytidylyltransferase n=1 Tax=Gymnopilus junonius TaxID=109634 RepID=A0A9P5TTD3_GYMJU|nr:cholinephosphate cytidylyltransferase [Gymnopilus junonius]